MDSILLLVNNPIDIFEETSRILIKIAENILKDPSNPKIRILQKSNGTVERKIIKVPGGKACLEAMGFQESEQSFNLPITDSLNKLKQISVEISVLKNGEPSSSGSVNQKPETLPAISKNKQDEQTTETDKVQSSPTNSGYVPSEKFKRIELPPYNYLFTNPFLKQIEFYFHGALIYENAYLHERALSVIPLKELEGKAQNALRLLQEKIKKEKLKDPEINLQDCLILELLDWFKNEFFEWVNSPDCKNCSGKTKFSHMTNNKELLIYTNRVEMHKCDNCNDLTTFPRYGDLNILLETRKGRCYEWANTFTLMCRAMGWDARFVMDETDHVWTEVYSYSQKKWLHCDPCENVCDTPLMYESGWGKIVSYVIAYSAEEVQDVTWRYSSKHKEVLTRRTKCSEAELVKAMITLRENRQKTLSQSRKDYLKKRFLSEVVQLMVETQPSDKDQQGRTSGSLDWRQARGEVSEVTSSAFFWEFDSTDTRNDFVSVQYSSALNQYEKVTPDGRTQIITKWESGAFESEGIFRKEESDWKKSYLCRTEKSNSGHITWKFKITDDNCMFGKIEYKFEHYTVENGCVSVKICNSDECFLLTDDQGTTDDFNGTNELTVIATLSGGKGNTAWQHAQLCREDLKSNTFTMKLSFSFKKRI